MDRQTPATVIAEEASRLEAGGVASCVVVCGAAAAGGADLLAGALPEGWSAVEVPYRRERALQDWVQALRGALGERLARRPGSTALREADEILGSVLESASDRERMVTVVRAVRLLRGRPDVALAVLVDGVDPFDEVAAGFVAMISDAPAEAVAVLPVVRTAVTAAWLRALHRSVSSAAVLVEVRPTLEELGPVLGSLSADARRYLRAVATAPGTHAELRRRLGDTGAFGTGDSLLARHRDELVMAGLVDLGSDGVIVPVVDGLADFT